MLKQWCTNVLRSKVAPVKEVARMIRRHFDGRRRLDPNPSDQWLHRGPLDGLFPAAKRKARGYSRFATMRKISRASTS
jgi:transposase